MVKVKTCIGNDNILIILRYLKIGGDHLRWGVSTESTCTFQKEEKK